MRERLGTASPAFWVGLRANTKGHMPTGFAAFGLQADETETDHAPHTKSEAGRNVAADL